LNTKVKPNTQTEGTTHKDRLNELVRQYQELRSDELFSEIYGIISKRWSGKTAIIANSRKVDELDVIAMYDDLLLKALEKYKPGEGDFENLFSVMAMNQQNKLSRKRKTVMKYETKLVPAEGESEAATFDRALAEQDGVENGDFVEYLTQKKETDQLQLIDSLMQPITDPTTTAIVEAILSDRTLGKLKPTAIAQQLNVHHSKVTRSLSKLRKYYDESTFGDYREYLLLNT